MNVSEYSVLQTHFGAYQRRTYALKEKAGRAEVTLLEYMHSEIYKRRLFSMFIAVVSLCLYFSVIFWLSSQFICRDLHSHDELLCLSLSHSPQLDADVAPNFFTPLMSPGGLMLLPFPGLKLIEQSPVLPSFGSPLLCLLFLSLSLINYAEYFTFTGD